MKSYAREIRKMLETLGLARKPRGWSGTFLAGVGVGAVAAVLLTPSNGKEVRKIVRSKAKLVAGTAEKKIAAITAITSGAVNGARKQVHA